MLARLCPLHVADLRNEISESNKAIPPASVQHPALAVHQHRAGISRPYIF